MAELVDAPDLGSGPERGAGSIPARRTKTFFEKYNGQGGRRLRNIRPEMVGQEMPVEHRIRDLVWQKIAKKLNIGKNTLMRFRKRNNLEG